MNIQSLGHRFDVSTLRAQLEAHPEVWDEHRFRTEHPRSPHREASDIWIRYNSLQNLGPHFNNEHDSVWYPVAEKLPAVESLCEQMLEITGSDRLGGVLVTRIPAGKQVYPHVDRGWHAEFYEKFAILLQGCETQAFCYEDCTFHCAEGDSFTFNNQSCHWVLNDSEMPRITLIICARRH